MKRLLITFKDNKEIERITIKVPDPELTELEKLQAEVASLKVRIEIIEKTPFVITNSPSTI